MLKIVIFDLFVKKNFLYVERSWCQIEVHTSWLSVLLYRVYKNSFRICAVLGYGLGLRKNGNHINGTEWPNLERIERLKSPHNRSAQSRVNDMAGRDEEMGSFEAFRRFRNHWDG